MGATADIRKALRGPGRLSINPTDADLTGTFPYGGTAIGAANEIRFDNELKVPWAVRAEEFGGAPIEWAEPGEAWFLACFLRAWDDDAVASLFPNTSTAAVSQRKKVVLGGSTRRAGYRMTDNAVKLVFTPDNTKDVPALCLYAAVPHQDAQAFLLSRKEELGMPVVFLGAKSPNHSGNVGEIDRISDLVL